MRILVVGGTRFIGRHVVEQAVDRGHEVTLFHRGRTGDDLFRADPRVQRRTGDRNTDLSALADGTWDATVDTCAYVPGQVQELAGALGERGGRYLLVSSVSAYQAPEHPGYTEDAPLAELDDPTTEEVTDETYGGLKVLCERAAVDRFGPSTVIVRPTYVVGPDDYTWRFPWWVARIARGGEVLAPGPADAPAQVIDVRDMAAWMVGLLERGESGAFHAASPAPPFSWGQQLDAIRAAVAPEGTTLTWVDGDFLRAAGVEDGELPLWSGDDPDVLMMTADPARAVRTGLAARPLADTVRDTLAWTRTVEPPEHPGVTADREADLLRGWRDRSGQPSSPRV
jgi:2'-hydroxyisoflavone reductase